METRDLVNGLLHMADDHKCCKETISEAIAKIEHLDDLTKNLVLMNLRMIRRLRRHEPEWERLDKYLNYLNNNNLISPLRHEETDK